MQKDFFLSNLIGENRQRFTNSNYQKTDLEVEIFHVTQKKIINIFPNKMCLLNYGGLPNLSQFEEKSFLFRLLSLYA